MRPTCQDDNICLLQGGAAVLPDVKGVAPAQQSPRHPAQEAGDTQGLHSNPRGPGRTEVSVAKGLPLLTGPQGTRDVTVRASLRLLTEVCLRVSEATGPGSRAAQGAFWPGSGSQHSAEPGARGGAQIATPESPSAPKITAPVLGQREATQQVGVPGQGTEAIHLLRGSLRDVQRQRPLRLRLPGSCKEVGQVIL